MPISIDVDHETRLVRAVATGPVTFQDTWSYHEKLVLEDALSYANLMDATGATFIHDDDEMMRLGARVSAYREVPGRGPVAVIASNDEQRGMLRRYFNLTGGAFPCGLFESEIEARRWLREVAEKQ